MDASPASLAGWLWLSNAVLDKGALGSAVGLTVPLATPLALLPGLFRLLAFLAILPVVVLSLLDIIGWCFFKGTLQCRPLACGSFACVESVADTRSRLSIHNSQAFCDRWASTRRASACLPQLCSP